MPYFKCPALLLACTAILSSALSASALPVANSAGDYLQPQRRVLLHRTWKVVDPDPEGLNCRMPAQFHGKGFDDRSSGDRYLSIADELLQDDKLDIAAWETYRVIPKEGRVYAYGGHIGALIIIRDRQGKPWLPVTVTSDGQPINRQNRLGNCFVRANQQFIQPIPE